MRCAAVAVRSGTPRTDYTVHTGRSAAFDSPVTTALLAWLACGELASVLQDASSRFWVAPTARRLDGAGEIEARSRFARIECSRASLPRLKKRFSVDLQVESSMVRAEDEAH